MTAPTGVTAGAARRHRPAALRQRWDTLAPAFAPAVLIVVLQQVVFPAPAGVVLRGVIVGSLTALVALGMALVYRANRILNFAQGDLGTVPTTLAVLLITSWGWHYLLSLVAGLAASIVLGGLVELVIIRRFFTAPRLLLTVATLGLSQLLAGAALLLPRAFGERVLAARIAPPFDLSFEVSPIVFNANDVIALVVAPLAIAALALFLRGTSAGIAIRASADSADRASLLGIPVRRLQTVVWAIAGLLAYVAIFLRAGIVGLPVGYALSFAVLLRSLAALMMGRLTNLPAICASAVALGVLELGVAWDNPQEPGLIDPILALVVVLALVARRRGTSRAEASDASSWQAADEVRPVPPELAGLGEVRLVRWGGAALLAVVALALPHFLGTATSLDVSAILVYATLGVSLVVLTGWAGQVSLGQIAFFGIGAAVGGKATAEWGLDLVLALGISAVVGALVAVVIGLPALRVRGLYLAVTTFAFALATTSYLLSRQFFDWIPTARIERPELLGLIDLDSPTRMYYLALAGLGVVVLAVRGVRRSRTGRVLIALRENERAAAAFGVNPTRAKLSAFALSGAIACFAGCIFVHHQQSFGTQPYAPGQNFALFTMVVIGGIGSVPGALLGAGYLRGIDIVLPPEWLFLASGAGALFVLLAVPGGLGGLLYRLRDLWLRWVAGRHHLVVPSLVADVRVPEEPEILERPTAAPEPAATGVAGQ
ncbi:MAG: ABC-type branched-chain amino acid transport system, permease component [Acidimicrobiales bacterium]|nr:ABC-type branched-chain amino acid transport system, permease component [Acidimicrobiales bacterium]